MLIREMMTASPSPARNRWPRGHMPLGEGPLVPLLRPDDDPADPVTLVTWHEALSSALAQVDLDAPAVDAQVIQQVRHGLCPSPRQFQVLGGIATVVGIALDAHPAPRIDLQELHQLEDGAIGRSLELGPAGIEQHVTAAW